MIIPGRLFPLAKTYRFSVTANGVGAAELQHDTKSLSFLPTVDYRIAVNLMMHQGRRPWLGMSQLKKLIVSSERRRHGKIRGARADGVLGPGMETPEHGAESEAHLARFYAAEEKSTGLLTPESEMPPDDPDADDEDDDKADDNDP